MKKILFIFMIVLLTACGTATKGKTDSEKVAADKLALTISGDLTNVTSDLVLPVTGENGSKISWQSSNTDVITNDGIITPSVEGDATVILTATITLNSAHDTKEFTLIVKKSTGPMCPGISDPSKNEVANSGFETGDLCGWTSTGEAFKAEYVKDLKTFWTGGSYNKDGSYLFTSNDHEGETGTLTSTTFTLGGSGWISFKLGAAKNTSQIYMMIMNTNNTEDLSDDVEIARFGNTEFDDNLYTANLVQYKADLSSHLNEELYVQIVDNATSDWAWISMDSFYTYYEKEADLPQDAVLATDIAPHEIVCNAVAPSVYEIINGGFDTGNICGWTATGEAFTHNDLTDKAIMWGDASYAPEGEYHYSSWKNNNESKTGTLTSSTFELGGTGYISFRIGAAKPKTNQLEAIYISIFKEDGTEVARYMNKEFNDSPQIFLYKADLSSFIGEDLYIQVVDNATSDWGILFMDSFNTYYTDLESLPEQAILAENLIVDDITAPVITGAHDFSVKVNTTVSDWLTGVTATDDQDGSVNVTVDTSLVDLTTVGTYIITYKAVDNSGNEGTVSVSVIVNLNDEIAPVISGNQSKIFVKLNSTEPNWLDGLIASDNVDGDISSNIIVDKGQFTIDTLGAYTITYTVTDESGNSSSVTTTALVVETLPTIENGGFETCDLSGWLATGDAFTVKGINTTGGFNSDGSCHFNTWTQGDNGGVGEQATGTLTSSIFELSGSGYITFKIGGAKDTSLIYISILTEDGTEIARYGNKLFNDNADLYFYKADLTSYIGQKLYIKVVDNATSDWAFSMLDSFNTYYENETDIPNDATLAIDIKPLI